MDKQRNQSRIDELHMFYTPTWSTRTSERMNSLVSTKNNTFLSTDLSAQQNKNTSNYGQLPSNSIINRSNICNATKENTLSIDNRHNYEHRNYVDQSHRT